MTDTTDWIDVGWAVYREAVCDAEFFPPLDDMEAQRRWLGGFGAAWVAAPDDEESVDEALVRMLDGREELLRQLRSHREGWGSRRVQ